MEFMEHSIEGNNNTETENERNPEKRKMRSQMSEGVQIKHLYLYG